MEQNNELKHYGVIGMKWGVRKNPAKAYAKSTKKRKKLESKYAKRKDVADTVRAKQSHIGKQLTEQKSNFDKLSENREYAQKRKDILDRMDTSTMRRRDRKLHARSVEDAAKSIAAIDDSINKSAMNTTRLKEQAARGRKQQMRWDRKTRRSQRKLEKFSKAMDKTFADMDQSVIDAGKEIFEKKYNK